MPTSGLTGPDSRLANNHLVSIVIPAFNAERFISRTLQCAQTQTYEHIEIIIVDDGSTDRTWDIVSAAATADSRIRVIRQPNQGVAAARNTAIAAARGHFIAPLDADDLWHPENISKQVEVMKGGGDRLGVVYAWSCEIDEDDRSIHREAARGSPQGSVYPWLIYSNFLSNASSCLIRKQCLIEVGGYDVELRKSGAQGCEDLQLSLAIAERWNFGVVPEFLIGYRQTADGMSQQIWRMWRSFVLVMAKARERHPELPSRLFRWSKADLLFWLAVKCRRAGNMRDLPLLLGLALLHDPALPARSSFWKFNKKRLASRWRWAAAEDDIPRKVTERPKFFDLPPRARAEDLPKGLMSRVDRQRQEFIKSITINSWSGVEPLSNDAHGIGATGKV